MAKISVFAQYLPMQPRIYVRTVDVSHAHAQLMFLHASAVHSDYYLPLAINLAEAGIRVWLPDLRGHGRSHGARGHVVQFQDYINDLSAIWSAFLATNTASTPSLLGGESLGALIALLTSQAQVRPDGLFLVSPALRLHFQFHPVAFRLLWSLRKVLGRARPLKPLPMTGVSNNSQVVDLIEGDPLTNRYYTLSFLLNLLDAQHRLLQPQTLSCRSLALFSADDPIVDVSQSAALLEKAGLNDTQFLDKALHSLVADSPERVVPLFLHWYQQHIERLPSSTSLL
ncbi:MAG: alpha/beta fold hydrolase [Sulfobacillus thermotolerans]|nr:alpha/beta fold hydrolase [Sulfobacillus thermotolerans]